jgi:CheY-like chemotaxis protein
MKGFEISGMAETGEEAVEMYRGFENKPELIIMDHRMPGMGGLDAAQEILQIEPDAKIIIVSADDNAVWEALKQGLFGMKKPFNIADLLSAIESSVPKEVDLPEDQEVDIPPEMEGSGLYLIPEEDGKRGLEVFRDMLSSGYKGLCFTRKHPNNLKKVPGLSNVPMVWFTSTPVKDYTNISPLNIQKMLIMLGSHVNKDQKTIFFVWGFEYILTNLSFDRVLNLLQVMNDKIMAANDVKVLFSLDPEILDEKQMKLLKKELKVIDP